MSVTPSDLSPTATDGSGERDPEDEVKLIPIVADPAAQRVKLDGLVKQFVDRFASMQRSDAWYLVIGVTIGGSELAAAMGWNPYKSFWEVVAEKSGAIAGWDGGSPACWWGIMFEDVAARFIEIDCGTKIYGEEICIQAIKGHRNSPDGYAVIGMYREEISTGVGYEWRIWTTDRTTPPDVYFIVLIETKCPFQRFPDSKVPRQYQPQVWSGLVVSPICHFGMFADFVFRRCTILNLGPTTAYDTIYHMKDRRALGFPFAWGMTGVYAPTTDAPIEFRIKGAKELTQEEIDADEESFGEFGAPRALDASLEAWHIYTSYFGMSMSTEFATRDVIDFGDCPKNAFDKAMSLISTKAFLTEHTDPCFADGRGSDLHSGKAIGKEIDRMRINPPADHYYLLGVIPWKLFKADYVPLERRVGFRQTLTETVDRVQSIVAAARASGNPVEYIRAQRELEVSTQSENAVKAGRFARPPTVSESDVQDLFDLL